MSLWLRVRGIRMIAGAIVVTLTGLGLPGSAVAATPSPAGPTFAAALFLVLSVPVAVGWGCARGDAQLEWVSVRPIRALDLFLALLAVGIAGAAALAMQRAGLSQVGSVAARAMLAYLACMLLAYPLVGWRIATIVPAIYLLAVALFGRGEDMDHPASWAWIATDGGNVGAWIVTIVLLGAGVAAYMTLPLRRPGSLAQD